MMVVRPVAARVRQFNITAIATNICLSFFLCNVRVCVPCYMGSHRVSSNVVRYGTLVMLHEKRASQRRNARASHRGNGA